MWELPVAGSTALLASGALGLGLGMFYDLFRLLRLLVRHHTAVVFAEDLVFCGLSAVSFFLLLLEVQNGAVRLYLLLGTLCGFGLWYHTLGRLLMAAADRIFAFLRWLLLLLAKPPALILGLLIRLFRRVRKKIAAQSKKIEKSA